MTALYLALLFIAGSASVCGGSAAACDPNCRVPALAGPFLVLAGAALLMVFFAHFGGLAN